MKTQIQHFFVDIRYRLKSPAYRLLRKSILFDAEYYQQRYPDVEASGSLPLVHYITNGFAEFRQPCSLFDARYYEKQLKPLAESVKIPLVHYLLEGWQSGMQANPLFDPEYYKQQFPNVDFSRLDPLLHFLQNDDLPCQSCSPLPYFDAEFYGNQYPDAAAHAYTPVKHYLTVGFTENRRPSVWFDTAWYKDKYDIFENSVSHYFVSGRQEMKSPCPLFDPAFYAKTYDVHGEEDLFAYYISKGMGLRHKPCKWFDPVFYQQTHLTGQVESVSSLHHFLQQGLQEKLSPNRDVHELSVKPIVSILVPVYNAKLSQLNNCIRSVLYQSYPHWQLCLADDCSTDPAIRPLLEEWAAKDERIKILFMAKNGGISAATNGAASLATGSYLALLDNDDELSQQALYYFVRRINRDGSDLLYSDEDLIGADGRRFSIFRKPEFNSELLLCHNYVTHCLVTKRSLFEAVGGCDSEQDGAQDLDLFLRLSERAKKISHIAKVLYHWRASASSTSINHSQKGYANEAGRRAIANALKRRGVLAKVQNTELKFYYRAGRIITEKKTVTVVVHWQYGSFDRDILSWLSGLVDYSGYMPVQILLMVDEQDICDQLADVPTENLCKVTCCMVAKDITTPDAYNTALDFVEGELVAFVSSDIEFEVAGWLSSLVEYGQLQGMGMIGGRVDRQAEQIPEVTPIPDFSIFSPLYFARYITNCSVLMNGLHCAQEVRSIDGGLCLIKTSLLKTVNGFNSDHYQYIFWINDICYRLLIKGQKNIYTPHSKAKLTINEPVQMSEKEDSALRQEMERFQKNWFSMLEKEDPFFNAGVVYDKGHSLAEFRTWLVGDFLPSP